MFLGARRKIEEDLEKIKFANLPKDKQERELDKIEAQKKKIESTQFEKNDRLALILATFSVVLPYFLVFTALIAIFVGLFYLFF
jgi:hypothetical protein